MTLTATVWVADHDDGTHRAAVITATAGADNLTIWKGDPSPTLAGAVDAAAGHAIDTVGLPCLAFVPTDAPDEHGNRAVLALQSEPIPVGPTEVAARLRVRPSTVYQWRQRGLLPAADFTVAGGDAWWWSTIHTWAVETGRLP